MHQFASYIEDAAVALDPTLEFDAAPARRAIVLALVGGTHQLATEWTLGGLDITKDMLVEALVALYVAAADAELPDPPARGPGR